MEKGFKFRFHLQNADRQLPNFNSISSPLDLGQQNEVPTHMSPHTSTINANGTSPAFPSSGLPSLKACELNEPHGWFHCMPHFPQALAPEYNSIFKEKINAVPCDNYGKAVSSNLGSKCDRKRFLVFDQSGDQTTLIFSSGIGPPVQCLTSWATKNPDAHALNRGALVTITDTIEDSKQNLTNVYSENHGDDGETRMHEDTEELNALLYSDDDDENCSENGEETSTGHSPSILTAYNKQQYSEGSAEEVASSSEPTKRQKLCDGGFHVPSSLMDTASSMKAHRCSESEDDAESSCADERNQRLLEFGPSSGNKRGKKERIRETVSILQSMIPGGGDRMGKDAIMVLDDAIRYLKSLKSKAKALGFDSP